jgi:hypothetical protein
MISYLLSILSFWSCALVSKTYIYSPIIYVDICTTIFQIKRNTNGSIEHYKARLVSKRFLSIARYWLWGDIQPYYHSFSIVSCHFFENVFFHGVIEEIVFMTQSPNFAHPSFLDLVFHLKMVLYGLKQAPSPWITTILLELGFFG